MSEIKVELLDVMGSDLSVCNHARQSFAKEFKDAELTQSDINLIRYLATGVTASEAEEHVYEVFRHMDDREESKALASAFRFKNKAQHFAPFTHQKLSVQITAPLFVARQMWKSIIGLNLGEADFAWSETSRRYVDSEPEYYTPKSLRLRAENVKQGSADEYLVDEEAERDIIMLEQAYTYVYNMLLKKGVAPEEARMFLPNNLMTQWTWTGSLLAFCRVINLRAERHAQKTGTQELANKLAEVVADRFPVSYKALCTPWELYK